MGPILNDFKVTRQNHQNVNNSNLKKILLPELPSLFPLPPSFPNGGTTIPA